MESRPSLKADQRDESPVRFGILSTAMINPAGIIHPAETHPGVVLKAIASRDIKNAQSSARSYKIEKAYGSYDDLLSDQDIDAVYISLPNGMHAGSFPPLWLSYHPAVLTRAEWAEKAVASGKHVLLEKPLSANGDEAVRIFDAASRHGKVVLEAFHWRFHPAAHVVRSLIESGRYGRVLSTYSRMTTPAGTVPKSDIRWQFDLAGGSLMDMTYTVSAARYFVGAGTPVEVEEARARTWKKDTRVDEAMEARMRFEGEGGGEVTSDIKTDMNQAFMGHLVPKVWQAPSIRIELERATIYYYK